MEQTQEIYPVKLSERSTMIVANHLGNEISTPRYSFVMTPYLGWQKGMADRGAFVNVVGPEMRV